MTKDECYYLGRITKPWGVKGQMMLFLDVDQPQDYAELDSALVDIKGTLVPHFFHVDNIVSTNKAIVTFEELNADQAAALAGHEVYLPLSALPKLEGNRFYYHEVRGFRVVDSEKGDIGILRDVIDYPAQALFQIDKNGTEILIPVIDPVIKKVDREGKTLHIEAPNGLIDLYLNDINK